MPSPCRASGPWRCRRLLARLGALIIPLAAAPPAAAQRGAHARWTVGAQAIGQVTSEAPAIGGRRLTEGYLTQPVVMAHGQAFDGRLAFVGMLDLEGATLRRGELNAGMAGEGYVDRRHPHTYLHEAVLVASERALGGELSLAAGKGFVPFGTDDPMSRPFVKYPVNHHLAQILERALVVGAARRGALTLEGSVFNGDEPEGPADAPNRARFADSWAARLTARPTPLVPGLELQASYAAVRSPEWATGQGADQRKQSASARYEMPGAALRPYALVEWARTREFVSGRPTFAFTSALGEAAVRRGPLTLGARYERTTRPEEERQTDPFRTVRPATDFSILGITRWQIATVTAALDAPRPVTGFGVTGFIEVARLRAVEEAHPSFFVPRSFYGADRLWSVSGGLRLRVGTPLHRMGRYGAAAAESASADHHMHAH